MLDRSRPFLVALCVLLAGFVGALLGTSPVIADGLTTVMGVVNNNASATNVKPLLIAGTDGTNVRSLSLDGVGVLQGNAADRIATGTITALNGSVSLSTNGLGTVGVTITGTWTATLAFQGSIDGTNFFGIGGVALAAGTFNGSGAASSVTANGQFFVNVAGLKTLRVIATAFTSGTATVTLEGNQTTLFTWQQSVNDFATVVQGVTGNGAVPGGPPVLVANFDGTNARYPLVDTAGRSINGDTTKATYVAGANFSPTATSATDVIRLTGSGSKTIKLRKLTLTLTQTTAGTATVLLVKRSTADSAGTFVAATAVPLDATDAAATATVGHYTANPTTGSLIGNVGAYTVFAPATATVVAGAALVLDWSTRADKAPQLNAAAQELEINLNSASITGVACAYAVEWTEE